MSKHTGRCRGGPYHNHVITDFDGFQVYKYRRQKIRMGDPASNIPPVQTEVDFGSYWWGQNEDTGEMEWLWDEWLEKKRKEWYQRKKARHSLIYLQNRVLDDPRGLSHVEVIAKYMGLNK